MVSYGLGGEALNAWSGLTEYTLTSDEITLVAPPAMVTLGSPRPRMRFLSWKEERTGREVLDRTLKLSPPHAETQTWWMNYTPEGASTDLLLKAGLVGIGLYIGYEALKGRKG